MVTLRAIVHTTKQYTSAQLIFGRDSIKFRRHNVVPYAEIGASFQQ